MGVAFSDSRGSHADVPNARRAVSLLETIIVLFIIGLMMALLFPALMAARHRALAFQCQNNISQLSMALSNSISATHRFPQPNRWTVDLLRWMEEQPLADTIPVVIPKGAVFGRPKPMQCPNQSDEHSTVVDVETCDYILVVDRAIPYDRPERVGWTIVDRPLIEEKDPHDPWYVGPEMTPDQELLMFTNRQGPHQGGLYYDSTGRTHPDK